MLKCVECEARIMLMIAAHSVCALYPADISVSPPEIEVLKAPSGVSKRRGGRLRGGVSKFLII